MIMRKLSLMVTVVIALLYASCIPCTAKGLFGKISNSATTNGAIELLNNSLEGTLIGNVIFSKLDSREKAKFKVALGKFNDYLEGNRTSSDLKATIAAARHYLNEPNAEKRVIKVAESLWTSTILGTRCTADSIDSLWQFATALQRAVPQIFEEKTPLGEAMVDFIQQLRDVCFKQFERKWLDEGQQIEADFSESKVITGFDAAHRVDPYPKPAANTGYVRMLQVAVYNYFDFKHSSKVEQPTKKELESPLGKEFAEMVKVKGPARAGKTSKKAGKSFVKEFIEEQYYKPCKELIDRRESKSILEPVGQLADLVNLNELDLKPIEGDSVSSFVWASRYYACKVLLMKNKTDFVKAVKEQLKKLNVI